MDAPHPPRSAPTWSLPPRGWQVRGQVSTDIDEHAAGLQGWRQNYDQLTRGAFDGRLSQVLTGSAQVYREGTSQALRQQCEIPEDAVWCGFPLRHDGSRIGGRTVGESGVMVCGSAARFDLVSPAGHDLVGIVVSRAALQAHARALGMPIGWSAIDHSACVDVPAPQRQAALAGLRAILSLAAQAQEAPAGAEALRDSLRQAMLAIVAGLFEQPQAARDARANATDRRDLVRRVHERVLARPDDVPAIADLCVEFNVSRRTLQYAFEAATGLGPNAYLRSIRLNGARRALRRGSPQTTTVQDVAATWGFWHFSQFASDYRAQFGERPSQTLARID